VGFPFRRPPGDLETVRSGARKIGAASADAATATSGFSGGACGLPTFSVSPAAEALSALTACCNPFSSPLIMDGARRRVRLADLAAGDEVADELGKATVVSVVAAVSAAPGTATTTQEHRLSVYTFDDHVEVGMADADDPTAMVYRWVDESALAEALAELAGMRP
jgi:hypothetical protein